MGTTQSRRMRNRLTMLYNAVKGLVAIPTDELKHPQRSTRRCPDPFCHFIELRANSDTLRYSFVHRTIRDWNDLPDHIIKSSLIDVFRKAISCPSFI